MTNDVCRGVVGSRYVLEDEIGEGTYGTVYAARDMRTGERVAIKVYLKKSLAYVPLLDQFIQSEIKIMKTISHEHENLVTLYEHLEDSERHFLVMEYCQLGQLEDNYDPHRTFSESQCAKYFSQITRAVYHMHSRNIVHRDLQLANLCLTAGDDIRICDYGLGQFFAPEQKFTGFRGNSMYALPDSLLGNEFYGPDVDIWSLGCCLYKMLTGYLPFRGAEQAINGQFMIPLSELELSENSKDLIQGMLCTDSSKRYNMGQIMNHPWVISYMIGEDAQECP
jgi:serine/threonine protein kinase